MCEIKPEVILGSFLLYMPLLVRHAKEDSLDCRHQDWCCNREELQAYSSR